MGVFEPRNHILKMGEDSEVTRHIDHGKKDTIAG